MSYLGKLVQETACLLIHSPSGVEHEPHNVGIVRPRPRTRYHGPVKPAPGRKDPWRVDENELRAAGDSDAAQQRSSSLSLVRDDCDFAADQRVDQGRFAYIGRA